MAGFQERLWIAATRACCRTTRARSERTLRGASSLVRTYLAPCVTVEEFQQRKLFFLANTTDQSDQSDQSDPSDPSDPSDQSALHRCHIRCQAPVRASHHASKQWPHIGARHQSRRVVMLANWGPTSGARHLSGRCQAPVRASRHASKLGAHIRCQAPVRASRHASKQGGPHPVPGTCQGGARHLSGRVAMLANWGPTSVPGT